MGCRTAGAWHQSRLNSMSLEAHCGCSCQGPLSQIRLQRTQAAIALYTASHLWYALAEVLKPQPPGRDVVLHFRLCSTPSGTQSLRKCCLLPGSGSPAPDESPPRLLKSQPSRPTARLALQPFSRPPHQGSSTVASHRDPARHPPRTDSLSAFSSTRKPSFPILRILVPVFPCSAAHSHYLWQQLQAPNLPYLGSFAHSLVRGDSLLGDRGFWQFYQAGRAPGSAGQDFSGRLGPQSRWPQTAHGLVKMIGFIAGKTSIPSLCLGSGSPLSAGVSSCVSFRAASIKRLSGYASYPRTTLLDPNRSRSGNSTSALVAGDGEVPDDRKTTLQMGKLRSSVLPTWFQKEPIPGSWDH